MTRSSRIHAVLVPLALLCMLAVGCVDGGADADTDTDTDTDTDSDTDSDPPIVDSNHTGWERKNCADCHDPLPAGHVAGTTSPACAHCHGGNGACQTPPGHHSSGCTGCHSRTGHGFTTANECILCHTADQGTQDCN